MWPRIEKGRGLYFYEGIWFLKKCESDHGSGRIVVKVKDGYEARFSNDSSSGI